MVPNPEDWTGHRPGPSPATPSPAPALDNGPARSAPGVESIPGQVPTMARSGGRARSRRLGWVVVAAMALALMSVAVGAFRAPVGHADAGSNFFLFGNGNPTLFSASNSNNTARSQLFASTCAPACPAVWTSGVGAFPGAATSTTSAQTIFAGTYRWQYWTTNAGADATVNWTFRYGDNVGCTTNPVTIAAFTAVPLRVNQAGTTAVVGTSASNVNVPAGKYMCLSVTWNSGGPATLRYGNNNNQSTNFTTPQVIFIPEYGAALLGLAFAIPLVTQLWSRRRARRGAAA